ncbi:MAG: hypothetical protein KF780_09465 [Sphingomonas sp.]|nr:hypothetical protein [Sphingomonas sp.]
MAALIGCSGGIASATCEDVAARAVEIAASEPIQIRSTADPREIARTPADLRCTASAVLSDERATTLYLRAYDDNGSLMVAYQEHPFD